MTWNEIILIVAIVLALIFIPSFLDKKLKPKTRLILSLVFFVVLMTWFIYEGVVNKFNTLQLIVLAAFAVLWVMTFYFRYKRYREANRLKSGH